MADQPASSTPADRLAEIVERADRFRCQTYTALPHRPGVTVPVDTGRSDVTWMADEITRLRARCSALEDALAAHVDCEPAAAPIAPALEAA